MPHQQTQLSEIKLDL